MLFKEFQDGCHGGHFGYQNGTILAILNLQVVSIPSTTFQFNPIYCWGADVVLKILKVATMLAILDIGMEQL